jgi:uncharacterized membrane protein
MFSFCKVKISVMSVELSWGAWQGWSDLLIAQTWFSSSDGGLAAVTCSVLDKV